MFSHFCAFSNSVHLVQIEVSFIVWWKILLTATKIFLFKVRLSFFKNIVQILLSLLVIYDANDYRAHHVGFYTLLSPAPMSS